MGQRGKIGCCPIAWTASAPQSPAILDQVLLLDPVARFLKGAEDQVVQGYALPFPPDPLLLQDKRGGVAPEVIAGLDLGEIGQRAAERFDRGVNAKRAAWRLFGPRGPGDGPGEPWPHEPMSTSVLETPHAAAGWFHR